MKIFVIILIIAVILASIAFYAMQYQGWAWLSNMF
jgi:hypothetical protein